MEINFFADSRDWSQGKLIYAKLVDYLFREKLLFEEGDEKWNEEGRIVKSTRVSVSRSDTLMLPSFLIQITYMEDTLKKYFQTKRFKIILRYFY